MSDLPQFVIRALEIMSFLFLFVVGLGILAFIVMYIVDRTQKTHAVRKNFPVIGRFRYLFEHLGGIFQTVFLCAGPGRAALQPGTAILGPIGLPRTSRIRLLFGSTKDLRPEGNRDFCQLHVSAIGGRDQRIRKNPVRPLCAQALQDNVFL